MLRSIVVVLILFLVISGCEEEKSSSNTMALATLQGVSQALDSSYALNSTPYGNVILEDVGEYVRITISLINGTPNHSHAIHLHMGSCEQPGHHWNQQLMDSSFCETMNLGETWYRPKAGDVGNINTDAMGNGSLIVASEFWSLGTNDPTDLVGAVIVLHENREDFFNECFEKDHMHVHNNPKIACGSIDLN